MSDLFPKTSRARLLLLACLPALLAILLAIPHPCHAQQTLALVNGATGLSFERRGGRVLLTAITDRARKREFLRPVADPLPLWRIALRPPNGADAAEVTLDEAHAPAPRIEVPPGNTQIRLVWTGLAAGPEAGVVDVVVTVAKVPASSLTDWRISVHNRSAAKGLWAVQFPCVQGLYVGKDGQAATPFGMGKVDTDPVHSGSFGFTDTYPSLLYSMQFASLSEGGSCLYLATHDPKAYVKQMRFQLSPSGQDLTYAVTQLPENMGLPHHDYQQPYPCLLGVIPGDWVDAAKTYRRWVLANSDWMRGKLPLAQRTDMPDRVKRLPFWVGFHGMTDEALHQDLALVHYMDVPVAVHLYHWHNFLFDTKYPDFWPPHPQTFGYVDQLHQAGALTMPYINLHLMDQLAPSWKPDGASRYAVTGPDGVAKIETWAAGANAQLVSMCPATPYWQTKFNGLTVHLVRDLKSDGIYCDQVASIAPTLCFNPAHGHPLGGGHYWVEGHNKQIANIRRAAAGTGKYVFLATEGGAEPYDFDLFLRCNEGAPFLTPIWQMVYSGYRLSFGFYFYDPSEWVVKLATQYLWGVQIGWAGQHDPKDTPENAAYERECARARYAGSDYLALGELLRPPQITGTYPNVKTIWQNFGQKIPYDEPAVQGSLWRAPNGSLGLALVNMDPQPQTLTFHITRAQAGFGNGPVGLKPLYPARVCSPVTLTGATLEQAVTLPGRSAAMVTLTEQHSAASAHLKKRAVPLAKPRRGLTKRRV